MRTSGLVDPRGRALPSTIKTPPYELGLRAGRSNAHDDTIFDQVADTALACVLDESQPDGIREKAGENLLGFCAGRLEILEAESGTEPPEPETPPLRFLTAEQTARVMRMPRVARRVWLALYRRGVRRWERAGGKLSGKRPVLPEIP